MNYEEFKEAVERELKDYLPPQYQDSVVYSQKVNKVNRTMDAIILKSDENIGITIYIDEMFERFVDTKDFETVMEDTVKNALQNIKNVPDFPALNSENMRNNVVFQLVNTFQNEPLLRNVPHREMLDLSVVYRWIISAEEYGTASIMVTNEVAQKMGVTEEQLFQLASKNTMRISPPVIESMADMMKELLVADGMPEELVEAMVNDGFGRIPMYVITNSQKTNGAATMLYDEALQELGARVGSDFYLMPSSIHECIAVPSYAGKPEELSEMVNDINLSQVSLQDRLSNQVYHYERNFHKLSMATDTPNKSLEGFKMMVDLQNDHSIKKGR